MLENDGVSYLVPVKTGRDQFGKGKEFVEGVSQGR